MSIVYTGPICARRGCRNPMWKNRLCVNCWRLARMFGRDMQMFIYEPLYGYQNDRDAVELPWDHWVEEAAARGVGVADLLGEASAADPSERKRPAG